MKVDLTIVKIIECTHFKEYYNNGYRENKQTKIQQGKKEIKWIVLKK